MTPIRLVFLGHNQTPAFQLESAEIPEINAGEILGRVKLATICGSDLHTISGLRTEAVPSILGHEGILEITKSKRPDFKAGDRVTFTIFDACSQCIRCLSGLPQKCEHLFKYGHSELSKGSGFDGCYASHIVIKKGTVVIKIPDHVTDKMAAPLNCAVSTVMNAISTLPPLDQSAKVLVQGAGLLGLYACAVLHNRGMNHVYCTDISEQRLALVPEFGGIPVQIGSEYPIELVKNSVSAVIEVCGATQVFKEGMSLLTFGGTYVLVGMVHPQSALDVTGEQIIRKCLTIRGVHNYAAIHLHQAVSFVSETATKYPYEKLVGDSYTLENYETAILAANSRKHHREAFVP